jgi:hypothetical protein
LIERPPFLTSRSLRLRNGKLAVKVELELKVAIVRHRHDDHVTLAIFGYENRFIQLAHKLRDFICLVSQIRDGFYDGHTGSFQFLARLYHSNEIINKKFYKEMVGAVR